MKEIIQPEVQELEIEVVNPFSTNPDYKQCRTCQEYKHKIDDYYYHGSSKKTTYLDCTKCLNLRELNRRRAERQEELESSGGSEKVHSNVGVWEDKYQREQTYMVMKVLGYTYSEECGHFLKPGVKEYVDGELKFTKVKTKITYTSAINWNPEHRKEIMELYASGGWTYKKLGKKYGVSTASICKLINKIKNGETC
jgi:hypothetical protein